MVSLTDFKHPVIDCHLPQFRTIVLQPRQADGIVRCSMIVQDLGIPTKGYSALSYMWGTDEPKFSILINNVTFFVRDNLAQFLLRAQNTHYGCPIFIDALCINQKDNDERSRLVKLMGRIYEEATQVISWLGSGNERVAEVFSFINQFFPLSAGLLDHFYDGKEDSIREAQQPWQALHLFCDLRYWTRVWIVQEIWKAKTVVFKYGDHNIGSNDLFSFLLKLRETVPCPAPLAERLFQSRLMSYIDSRSIKPELLDSSTLDSLSSVLWEYASSKCGEKRDRVYALISMANDAKKFHVDYKVSPRDLFSQLLPFWPRDGVNKMAFAKHMVSVVLSDGDNTPSSPFPRQKSYGLRLRPVGLTADHRDCTASSTDSGVVGLCVAPKYHLSFEVDYGDAKQALAIKTRRNAPYMDSRVKTQIAVNKIRNSALLCSDTIHNIEDSGLLVIARYDAHNNLHIVSKLSILAGLNHGDGSGELSASWLPWSPNLVKSDTSSYSVEKTHGEYSLRFDETSFQSFMMGVAYERHDLQIQTRSDGEGARGIEIVALHWQPLLMGDFSVNDIRIVQNIYNFAKGTTDSVTSLSITDAIRALTLSTLDISMERGDKDETVVSWRSLLERKDDSHGYSMSQLHKVFY